MFLVAKTLGYIKHQWPPHAPFREVGRDGRRFPLWKLACERPVILLALDGFLASWTLRVLGRQRLQALDTYRQSSAAARAELG